MLTKVCMVKSYSLSSGHILLWEVDQKEDRAPKNWCFRTVVLDKTVESPLNSKEIKPVNLKGNQPWILIGRIDAEVEAPILWPPDGKSWFIGKDPDAGKDWRQKEKRVTEDEMVGWHHQQNGHEFGQTLGNGEGRGSLPCCSPWGHEELDTTWWLNNDKNRALRASLVAQWVKNPPSMQETQEMRVWTLGWEDPLEEELAPQSSK